MVLHSPPLSAAMSLPLRCCVCIVALLFMAGASNNVCRAEIPPLSIKELFLYSDHVFTGTVTASEYKDVPNVHHPEDWINRHWKLDVIVTEVYQTVVNPHEMPPEDHDNETVWQGQSIHVMMWKAWKRPIGITGPGGVGMLPNIGESVSFFTRYLHRDPRRRSMYQDSFPHVEEDSEQAAQEEEVRPKSGPRKTAHTKAYNALTPNGIETVSFLEATKKSDDL